MGDKRIQRISQACHNCRRKKIRCSGSKPTCDFCERLAQDCTYSDTESDGKPIKRRRLNSADDINSWKYAAGRVDEELMDRWSTMETRMADMAKSMDRLAAALENQFAGSTASARTPTPFVDSKEKQPEYKTRMLPPAHQPTHSSLPPLETIMGAADVYFQSCHNQPYSIFHEASFKSKLAAGELPTHLVLAMLASAARHSTDPFFSNRKELIATYSMESWKALVLPWNGIEDRMGINLVQTILMLAVIDYTDGRAQGAWLKVGLGIRIIQDFGLMREPDPSYPVIEQEERRRIFWSFFICDKLMSCGREKPLAMLDENCKVNLPCHEDEFRRGKPWASTPTLHDITQDLNSAESPNITPLSPYAMAVKMASVLGQCTHYTLGEHRNSGAASPVPWSPTSSFSSIMSSLLQIESDFGFNISLSESIQQNYLLDDGSVDGHSAAPLFFARTLFHLCHCLLRHPILFRRRLFSHGGRTPLSFVINALDTCRNHARLMMLLIREVKDLGCPAISPSYDPFYSYCIVVAGSIHSLFLHSDDPTIVEESRFYLDSCMQLLDEQSLVWKNSSFMTPKLQMMQNDSKRFVRFLSPTAQTEELAQVDITDILEALDYGRLSTPQNNSLRDVFSVSNLPSPVFDDFLNLFPLGYNRSFENPMQGDLAPLPSELLNPYIGGQSPLGDFRI